jgi:Tol biopolymer transport system component
MHTFLSPLKRVIAFLVILTQLAISTAYAGSSASIPISPIFLPQSPDAGSTLRVSVASDRTQGNNASFVTGISADGRYVLFYSEANNLVSNDTNSCDWDWDGDLTDCLDVFVRDSWTGQIRLVSVDSNGVQGNADSGRSAISSDGRHVAFHSRATNLVSDDTNVKRDIFVHDLQTGETERVSVDSDGDEADDESYNPSISGDGRYVAFNSSASNLVSDDTNERSDIFVHDRQTGETVRVSVDSDNSQSEGGSSDHPSISVDGRYVAFESAATNLVDDDTNNTWDIFVHDLQTGDTVLVSVAMQGGSGDSDSLNAFFSGNGRYIVFESYASDLVENDIGDYSDIFLRDLQTGETSLVSVTSGGEQADHSSTLASISPDGRYIVYSSKADNLDPACTESQANIDDVFLYDRQTEQVTCVSPSIDGLSGDWFSEAAFVSTDGNHIAFESAASNLVFGDTNNFCETDWDEDENDNCWDVFLRIVDTGDNRVLLPLVVR